MLKMVENLKKNSMDYMNTINIIIDAAKTFSYDGSTELKCLIYGDQVFYVYHANKILHMKGIFIAGAMFGAIYVDDHFFEMSKESQQACLNHEEGHLRDERINDFKIMMKYTLGVNSVVEPMEFTADDNSVRVCGKENSINMLKELVKIYKKHNLYLPKKSLKLIAKRIQRIENM